MADFPVNGADFSRKRGGFLGGNLPEQRAKNYRLLGGFYLFAQRKFKEEIIMMMEEIKVNKVALAIALAKDDVKRFFAPKAHDLMEEVSAK